MQCNPTQLLGHKIYFMMPIMFLSDTVIEELLKFYVLALRSFLAVVPLYWTAVYSEIILT